MPGVVLVVVATFAAGVRAQDSVEEIIKKPGTLSPQDRGTLETEIAQRVKRVFSGTGAASKIENARERLVKPVKIKGANPSTVDVYADLMSGELESMATGDDFDVALTAVLVLEELESAKTLDSLLASLHSKHAGVRYTAARAIGLLRAKIKDSAAACEKALSALGQAGSTEADEQVLRRIYAALNFKASASSFKFDDQAAAALNLVLASRVQQIKSGNRDTSRDEDAIAAATACYGGANAARQAELIGHLYVLLDATVERYLDADTAPEALADIAKLAQRIERAMHDMIKASKAGPPRKLVSDLLKTAAANREKLAPDVRAALQELRTVLRGDPWKLP